jgi:hypothetical protein
MRADAPNCRSWRRRTSKTTAGIAADGRFYSVHKRNRRLE